MEVIQKLHKAQFMGTLNKLGASTPHIAHRLKLHTFKCSLNNEFEIVVIMVCVNNLEHEVFFLPLDKFCFLGYFLKKI